MTDFQLQSKVAVRRVCMSGFTAVELLVAVGIGALVLAAVGFFMVRVLRLPPAYIEQGSITADAEVEIRRMSNVIRNARDIGVGAGVSWITVAGPYSIGVYSNIDGDDTVESVWYWLQTVDNEGRLYRSVDGGWAELLARSVRNRDVGEALFTYYSLGGDNAVQLEAGPRDLNVVDRVAIRLIVDVDLSQLPEAATIETVVTPRDGGDWGLSGVPPPPPPPPPPVVPPAGWVLCYDPFIEWEWGANNPLSEHIFLSCGWTPIIKVGP